MPDLDELDLTFCSLQGSERTIDTVAGIAVNASHAH